MSHVVRTASVPCSFFQFQNIVYIFLGGFTVSRPRTAKSIAAQIEKSYKKTKSLLEESMRGLPKGCKSYLDHTLAVAKLAQNYREERASRGLDPVNLGNAARTVYSFKATIDTQSAPLDEERARFEREMDEQYPDSTQSPPAPAAPKAKKSKRNRSKN